jgi:hypothetical protein
VFTKNRDRLLTTRMSRKVMAAILARREVAPLRECQEFCVSGVRPGYVMAAFIP